MALKKICPKCHKLIDAGQAYCNECTEKRLEERADVNRYYDKHYRDREAVEFYNSAAWKRVCAIVKQRQHGLCILCLEEHVINYIDITHHIIERTNDKSKELDPHYCAGLCKSHHNNVHNEYKKNDYSKRTMQERLRRLIGYGGY